MTATNHALTGAVIGLAVYNPFIAIISAFMSHFVLDAIPHFGFNEENALSTRYFALYLVADALLCVLLVAVLWRSGSTSWLLASFSAFAATSPDIMWIGGYLRVRRHLPPAVMGPVRQFHKSIQWFERPAGLLVELAWAGAAVGVLAMLLQR